MKFIRYLCKGNCIRRAFTAVPVSDRLPSNPNKFSNAFLCDVIAAFK